MKKIKEMTLSKERAKELGEYWANVSFADDIIISPNGIDETRCFDALGRCTLERCTKIGDNKFKIEVFRYV